MDFYNYNESIDGNNLKIISIDPGVKNFAIRVEMINPYQLIHYDVHDLRENINKDSKNQDNFKMMMKLNEFLISMKDKFQSCKFILIERQLGNNPSVNNMYHHMVSYFMNCGLYDECNIVGMSPKMKSKHLNFPKGLKGKNLKTYTTNYIIKSYEEENDIESLNIINSHDKKDDLADTKAMIKVLIKLLF